MADFEFHTAFREIMANEIDNLIGTSVTIYPLTETNDTQGRDTSTFGAGVAEYVQMRTMSEEHQRLVEGEWDSEDMVLIVRYNTSANMHAKIVSGNSEFVVQKIDDIKVGGNTVCKRLFCKRQHPA